MTKPSSQPMLAYYQLDPWEHISNQNVTIFIEESEFENVVCENVSHFVSASVCWYINGLVQERHNSIANALELRLSCTNPSI